MERYKTLVTNKELGQDGQFADCTEADVLEELCENDY